MFADPQTVTISGDAKTLNRTATGLDSGNFSSPDRSVRMSIAHSYGRRTRHMIKLTVDSLVPSPIIAGQNISQSMTVHLVVDVPNGYSTAAAKAATDGLLAHLSASSGAAVSRLVGGES